MEITGLKEDCRSHIGVFRVEGLGFPKLLASFSRACSRHAGILEGVSRESRVFMGEPTLGKYTHPYITPFEE